MAGNQLCVCVFCLHVCVRERESFGAKSTAEKEKKRKRAQSVVFSNPVCPPPCSQDSSSLHHTTGCFCTITRMLLTYMEMQCENKTLPLPSCPPNAPVCAWACVCVCVCACMPEYVFLHACPLCAPRFCVQRELLALIFSNAGKCWYPY